MGNRYSDREQYNNRNRNQSNSYDDDRYPEYDRNSRDAGRRQQSSDNGYGDGRKNNPKTGNEVSSRNSRQKQMGRKEQEAMQRRAIKAKRKKAQQKKMLMILGGVLIIIIIVIIILISCGNKNKKTTADDASQTVVTAETDGEFATEETSAVTVNIVNEKPVNLYTMDYNTMTCNKVTSLNKTWSVEEDLEAFGAFATSEESFAFTSETQAHNDIWNSISTTTTYKIGYELSFDVGGEHKIITILKPGDIETNADLYNGDYPESGDYSGITGYMGVWVYDDMHQDGGYYTHITQSEVTDETLLTSIKLRPTPQSEQISNLVLRGFSYSSTEEFDANGNYIGNYAATVTINK